MAFGDEGPGFCHDAMGLYIGGAPRNTSDLDPPSQIPYTRTDVQNGQRKLSSQISCQYSLNLYHSLIRPQVCGTLQPLAVRLV